jgi:hypothetical protein
MFGKDLVPALTLDERAVLNCGWWDPAGPSEWGSVQAAAKKYDFQYRCIVEWLRQYCFTRKQLDIYEQAYFNGYHLEGHPTVHQFKFRRTKYSRQLALQFPATAQAGVPHADRERAEKPVDETTAQPTYLVRTPSSVDAPVKGDDGKPTQDILPDEAACRVWLAGEKLKSPNRRAKSKDDFWRAAKERFPGISERGFLSIWRDEIGTESSWSKPGPIPR